jgi:hypothetical protein
MAARIDRPSATFRPRATATNYNNVRVNNVNVNVNNNNNYYNRFNNNQNLRTGSAQSPIANSPNRAQARVGNTATAGTAGNWKGQSTYGGARTGNTAAAARPTPAPSQPVARLRVQQHCTACRSWLRQRITPDGYEPRG